MASPSTHHAPSAAHSGQPKLPGTAGISFMQMMATLTTAPPAAMTTPLRSRLRRASAPRTPRRGDRTSKDALGPRAPSDSPLPGIPPPHDRHNRHVEQSSSEDRERDRAAQRPKSEVGPRFLRRLGNGFESRHEIGNDLRDQKH